MIIRKQKDGSWSASGEFQGRALVAEGASVGAAFVAYLVLAADVLEKKEAAERVVH